MHVQITQGTRRQQGPLRSRAADLKRQAVRWRGRYDQGPECAQRQPVELRGGGPYRQAEVKLKQDLA